MHHLYSKIIAIDNLFTSFREFKRGKRRKAEVALYDLNLEENIFSLHDKLKSETYKHGPYCQFKISDPKPRIIHKATVEDRVVHQAVYRILYPVFDKDFISDSYSSRNNKGTHKAIKRLVEFVQINSRHYRFSCFALKMDVKKFFDSIDHQVLMLLIAQKVKCPKTLNLVREIIGSFFLQEGKGLPLGNVTSQLFANVHLDGLDQFIKRELRERYYIRFCDDLIIVKKDNEFFGEFEAIKRFLNQKLLLRPKSSTLKARKLKWGFDYLGYVVLPHHLVIRRKTKKRILKNIVKNKQIFYQGLITQAQFQQSINAYLAHLKHANSFNLSQEIRRRETQNGK